MWFLSLQVLDIVSANPDDSGPLNLNIVGRRDLSSSWVQEESTPRKSSSFQVLFPLGCLFVVLWTDHLFLIFIHPMLLDFMILMCTWLLHVCIQGGEFVVVALVHLILPYGFVILTLLFQFRQDSQGASEEEPDSRNLEIKEFEENVGKPGPEGVPKVGENGSENPERKELEVSDAGGILHHKP